MINHKAYPKYKDSGVEWLGEIPEEWEALKMKYLFSEKSDKNRADQTLLSVTQDRGVIPRSWVENRMVMPSGALESFKFIRAKDFCISLRSFEGGLEYCHHDGLVSPAYTVLRKQKDIEELYCKYLFKSKTFISELQTSVVGIREGKNISYEELKYSRLPIPSYKEQIDIASFLDDKVGKIDETIAQKEQLIQLLGERKQIIIQNAVTKGLNPNAPMKDSGIEWIGKIPEHWDVSRVKFSTSYISKGTTPSTIGRDIVDEGTIRFLKSENIVDGSITRKPLCYIDSETSNILERSILKSGDVLFVIAGASLGKTAVLVKELEGSNTNQAVCFLRPNKKNHSSYLEMWLNSSSIKAVTWLEAVQSAQPNLSMESLGNFNFPYPHSMNEQQTIIDHVQTKSSQLNKAIHQAEQSIKTLKEYKATLINSAVTGKIKVV